MLDANALIRLYRDGPGADIVENLIRQAREGRAALWLSVINLSEILYVLNRYVPWEEAVRFVQSVRAAVTIAAVDEEVAFGVAALRSHYKLSLADSCAVELALRIKCNPGHRGCRVYKCGEDVENTCPAAALKLTPRP